MSRHAIDPSPVRRTPRPLVFVPAADLDDLARRVLALVAALDAGADERATQIADELRALAHPSVPVDVPERRAVRLALASDTALRTFVRWEPPDDPEGLPGPWHEALAPRSDRTRLLCGIDIDFAVPGTRTHTVAVEQGWPLGPVCLLCAARSTPHELAPTSDPHTAPVESNTPW